MSNLAGWKTEYLIAQLRTVFGKNFFDSKHELKVYFKPSRKNPDFIFLPLPSELVWLKIRYLS